MAINERSISSYLEALASKEPAPGGGAVAAITAAQGMALLRMVKNLSPNIGAEGLDDSLAQLTTVFTNMADMDGEAFTNVIEAYSLPKEIQEHADRRQELIQKALLRAAEVPLKLMEAISSTPKLVKQMARLSNPNVVTDLLIALQMFRTAIISANYNVRINLQLMSSDFIAKRMSREADKYLKNVETIDNLIAQIEKTGFS